MFSTRKSLFTALQTEQQCHAPANPQRELQTRVQRFCTYMQCNPIYRTKQYRVTAVESWIRTERAKVSILASVRRALKSSQTLGFLHILILVAIYSPPLLLGIIPVYLPCGNLSNESRLQFISVCRSGLCGFAWNLAICFPNSVTFDESFVFF